MLGYLLDCESLVLGDILNHLPGYLKHSAFFWTRQSFSASDKDWLVDHIFAVDIHQVQNWRNWIDKLIYPCNHIYTVQTHLDTNFAMNVSGGQISVYAGKELAEYLVPMTHEPPENGQVLKHCPFVLDWNPDVGFSNSQASRKLKRILHPKSLFITIEWMGTGCLLETLAFLPSG